MQLFRIYLCFVLVLLNFYSCKKSSSNSEPQVITFPDANFELLVREALKIPTGDILKSDLESLIYLNGETRNITDITGIEYCINLDTLRLSDNQIDDISSLAELDGLVYLGMSSNPISDISVLSNLINLKRLHIGYILADNYNIVESLSFLEVFGIAGNNVQDIGFLKNLLNLKSLFLANNLITDIKPMIDNQGIGSEDFIRLTNNPLDEISVNTYIPQLEARGVTIDF